MGHRLHIIKHLGDKDQKEVGNYQHLEENGECVLPDARIF